VLARVRQSPVDQIVVVVGAHDIDSDARVVHCPDWEAGPGVSLRCGLRALAPDVEAAIVVLADGPNLAPAAIGRVIEHWRESGGEIVAASYDGQRGHPVLVPRSAWNRVPDEGLKSVAARTIACDDLGSPGDVDTPADLV
jgi:CTP:molybdopterin cytidylyltransferase MocA